MASLDTIRDENGKLPAFAWPGGYPILYIMRDGDVLCPDCANGENGATPVYDECEICGPRERCSCGWCVEGYDIHYEGDPAVCDHCGAEIESAYGPVEHDPESN